MIKKIILITLFVLFTGVLVAGGVYRTTAKSANETRQSAQNVALALENHEIRSAGQGLGSAYQQKQGEGQGERQGQGLGNGGVPQGRSRNTAGEPGAGASNGQNFQGNGQSRNQQAERAGEIYMEHESIVVEGMVTQAPALGVDMIIITDSGDEVLIGTGPGYLQEMGYELAEGDTVQVSGFWEEEEFKAETITRDGETIALRDAYGRPMWSGAVRNGRGGGQGYGQNRQANS